MILFSFDLCALAIDCQSHTPGNEPENANTVNIQNTDYMTIKMTGCHPVPDHGIITFRRQARHFDETGVYFFSFYLKHLSLHYSTHTTWSQCVCVQFTKGCITTGATE